MKRLDFNPIVSFQPYENKDRVVAEAVLEVHKDTFRSSGEVFGYWIGYRFGDPYVLVAVREGYGEIIGRKIPDMLDGLSVYYEEIDWDINANRSPLPEILRKYSTAT